MGTVLFIALWILVGLLGLILLLLAIPVGIWLQGEHTSARSELNAYAGLPMRILGGGVVINRTRQDYQIIVLRKVVKEGSLLELKLGKQKKKREKDHTSKKKEKSPVRSFFEFSQTPNLAKVLRRFLGLLFVQGYVHGRIGFEDPATSGYFNMILSMARTAAPGAFEELSIDFSDAVLEGELDLRIVIWIPYIVVGALVIAVGRDGRQLLRYLLTKPKLKTAEAQNK